MFILLGASSSGPMGLRHCLSNIFVALSFASAAIPACSADPEPPVWPDNFEAFAISNRTGRLAQVFLVYDWPGGRNLNIIANQQGSLIIDLEFTNGTSFYADPAARTCKTVKFPVGILSPNWLQNATFLGIESVDNTTCNKWTKADFITYWEDVNTRNPIRWTFFDGAQFDIMFFSPGFNLPDSRWAAPAYCFEEGTHEIEHLQQQGLLRDQMQLQ